MEAPKRRLTRDEAAMTVPKRGRSRAVVVGALVPLAFGETAILVLLVGAASHTAWGRTAGWFTNVALMLPGTILLGAIFAFPLAAALVCSMTWLAMRVRHVDNVVAWTLAGPLFASPLALLLSSLDSPGSPAYGIWSALTLGAIGGLAAGLSRPRPTTPARIGPEVDQSHQSNGDRSPYGPPAPLSSPAWEAGLRAAATGQPKSACPYDSEPERTTWIDAWTVKTTWFDRA